MLKEISKITGLTYDEGDALAQFRLRRIMNKLPSTGFMPSLDNREFVKLVRIAAKLVEQEGDVPLEEAANDLGAPEEEKKFKIKRSPKGARIKIAAANGVRFSFGPVWNESVVKCKGIAVVEANRAKLNHQALLAGISNAEQMDVKDLCAAIAATF